MEPCSIVSKCATDLSCRAATQVCVVPCTQIQENKDLEVKRNAIIQKQAELEELKKKIEGALMFYTAKRRGETLLISEELHDYYSAQVEYCVDIKIDTRAAHAELCKDDPNDEFCKEIESTANHANGKVCNSSANQAEVNIHDYNIQMDILEADLAVLLAQEKAMVKGMKDRAIARGQRNQQNFGWLADCNNQFLIKEKMIEDFEKKLQAVIDFIDKFKCQIIDVGFMILGEVLNAVAGALPGVGQVLMTMQKQPACLTIKKWKEFKIPALKITGDMFYKAVKMFFCLIGNLDPALSIFNDVCSAVSMVGMIVDILIAGLCGAPGTAFVLITKPFVKCNAWDCGDGNVRVAVPAIFTSLITA